MVSSGNEASANKELASQLDIILNQLVDKRSLPAESQDWIAKGKRWAQTLGSSVKYSGDIADSITKIQSLWPMVEQALNAM